MQIILIVVVAYLLLGRSCTGMKEGFVNCNMDPAYTPVDGPCGALCKSFKKKDDCKNSKRNCFWDTKVFDHKGVNGPGDYDGSKYNPPYGECNRFSYQYKKPILNAPSNPFRSNSRRIRIY